ncbi:hypothetical protein [Ferrimonas balearica]|uniref:hypothetical protein n=1 Tax=Ferrimonas balearica TaxID=44012 RepID=UPI001C9912F5|nr:hypothetical protein [Ferrimonas balearica]MBY5992238.1 hypothetical protein [Ferrimonas balearica]
MTNSHSHSHSLRTRDWVMGLCGGTLGIFFLANLHWRQGDLVGPQSFHRLSDLLFAGHWDGSLVTMLLLCLTLLGLLAVHASLALRRAAKVDFGPPRLGRSQLSLRKGMYLVRIMSGVMLVPLLGLHLFTIFSHPHMADPEIAAVHLAKDAGWSLYALLFPVLALHISLGLGRFARRWWQSPARTHARHWLARLAPLGVVMLGAGMLTLAERLPPFSH